MARDFSSHHQHQPRLLHGLLQLPAMEEETRAWAELPRDALLLVLQRLEIIDIIFCAGQVCRSWRHEAREEPGLWRRIDMLPLAELPRERLMALARTAVRRSDRQCETFSAKGLVDRDDFFFSRGRVMAPSLKSLRLISCNISVINLSMEIKKCPLLEELELSLHSNTFNYLYSVCAAAAQACPLLKSLRLNKERYHWKSSVKDREAKEIAKMRALRSLQLFGNSLSNDGLAAILDGCAQLESLDIRHCFNVKMDSEMQAKSARIRTFRLPNDSMDDYDLPFGSPEMWRNFETPILTESFRGDILWDSW